MQPTPSQPGNFRRARSDAAPRGDRLAHAPGLRIFDRLRRALAGVIRPRVRRGPALAGTDSGGRTK